MLRKLAFMLVLPVLFTGCSFNDWFNSRFDDRSGMSQQPTADSPSSPTSLPATNANCYDPIFLRDRGIAVGDTAIVRQGIDTPSYMPAQAQLYHDRTSGDLEAMLPDAEEVTILEGPFCYATRNAQNRWWRVRVTGSGLDGFVDEYATYVGILNIYLDPVATPSTTYPVDIRHFTVSIPSAFGRPANQGETVFISWDVGYASDVSVMRVDTGEVIGFGRHNNVPFLVPENRLSIDFKLLATGIDGLESHETRTLHIDCPDCRLPQNTEDQPTFPTVSISYQSFEGGLMLYYADTGQIYVLYNNGSLQKFADSWQGETVVDDAPEGYTVPQFGFGVIWSTHSAVKDALGWATGAEIYVDGQLMPDGILSIALSESVEIRISNHSWHYQTD